MEIILPVLNAAGSTQIIINKAPDGVQPPYNTTTRPLNEVL
ncbi:MAG TPA: hypothetical protein VJA94_16455 [Candidatus Angelobacter sp.]